MTDTELRQKIKDIKNYCRINYGEDGICDEYEEEWTSRVLQLITESNRQAEWEAYKNTHDCRIRVTEEHIGMEMTPDVYAINNMNRLTIQEDK